LVQLGCGVAHHVAVLQQHRASGASGL
jgi:hypothetical protein